MNFVRALGRRNAAQTHIPATARGDRIYAIGDVHGRLDLLEKMLERIGDHSRELPPARTHLVVLGDLIDRGPASADVLRTLHNIQRTKRNVVVLLGNHEEIMLEALKGDIGALEAWLDFGGVQTLESFGIALPDDPRDMPILIEEMRRTIPRDLREWLAGLPLSVRSGDYFFCHAGIKPGVPLRRQQRDDLLWIRGEFLESEQDHGVVIVHGHSVEHEVTSLPNRIGIDSGAYSTGKLTALYLEGAVRDVLTVTD